MAIDINADTKYMRMNYYCVYVCKNILTNLNFVTECDQYLQMQLLQKIKGNNSTIMKARFTVCCIAHILNVIYPSTCVLSLNLLYHWGYVPIIQITIKYEK